MRYHYTPTRITEIKNIVTLLSVGEQAEKVDLLYISGANVK